MPAYGKYGLAVILTASALGKLAKLATGGINGHPLFGSAEASAAVLR